MTADEYKEARQARGRIADIARTLKISAQSIWNRENAKTPVSKEAELALLTLPLKEDK